MDDSHDSQWWSADVPVQSGDNDYIVLCRGPNNQRHMVWGPTAYAAAERADKVCDELSAFQSHESHDLGVTVDEFCENFQLLILNKYDYLTGRKEIPPLVGRILMSYFLWPDEENSPITPEFRMKYLDGKV